MLLIGGSLLLALLLCRHADAYRMRPATPAEIIARYNPAEVCAIAMLAQNTSTLSEERKRELSSLLSQPYCVGKSLSEVWVGINSLKGGSKTIRGAASYFHSGGSPDPQLEHFPTRCGMSVLDRVPIWTSAWDTPASEHVPAMQLTHILKKYNVHGVPFFGDSLGAQVVTTHHSLMSFHGLNFKVLGPDIRTYPCGLAKIGVAARDPHQCPTGNNSACTVELNVLFIEHKIRGYLDLIGNKTAVALMHLFGAHIWNVDVHVAKSVAMSLLAAADVARSRGSAVLIVGSPSQGFIYDYDKAGQQIADRGKGSGIYSQNEKLFRNSIPGPCCAAPTDHEANKFRDRALQAALDAADVNWRQKLGWVDFNDATSSHGAHVDHGGDCTHITYTPFLLDPLWMDMAREIDRLLAPLASSS